MKVYSIKKQTVTDELSEQLQRRQSFVSSNISELTSSVTDITTKHSSFEAELENIKAIMATNKRSQKGQFDLISLDVKEAKHRSSMSRPTRPEKMEGIQCPSTKITKITDLPSEGVRLWYEIPINKL
ncbi:hypothetical protein QR680_018612 [Steinernema hermaphroditum]|uniref:Uncharacterized protein n=1 Tax=Steinernema hermaphroditum TaxID=289476 RepID=A0AA39LR10_9BILA|nr:hypothetical protein QR680_018612 [Steinernema hermaphroditum]